ncbi:hypothetical protein KMW28_26340 [Flammeovirga yaeyamensis]|uniref:Secretion system C-terminal sorting domain-containing protein n=1 Tax=Flammeovirga yaeyamensis TaxID=367791 RepID=A0AAX1NDY3_9BACT|nr:hypothetical protein [Flammeovirga yaeyamensis]MBB3699177.1 hypothetical protein [Flammeovirga yaeyamensis]NMF35559.1 hypothetical protein [Flammeovirga yaeyamensis]QWG04417.1 hypothetical protein KMW28_26340 [Flammeovirga yaeyamensis]
MTRTLRFLIPLVLFSLTANLLFANTAIDYYLSKSASNVNFIFNSLDDWKKYQWFDKDGKALSTYPSDLSTVVLREEESITINLLSEIDDLNLAGIKNISQNHTSSVYINTNEDITVNILNFTFDNGNLYVQGETLLNTTNITNTNKAGLVKVEERAKLNVKGKYYTKNDGEYQYAIQVLGEATFDILNAQTKFGINVAEDGYMHLKNIIESKNNLDLLVCGTLRINHFDAKNGLKVDLCGPKGTNCSVDDGRGGKLIVDGKFECKNSIEVVRCGYIAANESSCDCVICDGDIDLLVELTYFKGQQTPTGHLLIWETASEHNSSHFNLQASNDRKNWETISTIDAAGTSNVKIKYQYHNQTNTKHYYRLEQVDFDAKKEYFGIVSFNNVGNDFSAKVYPTITQPTEQLNVEIRNINLAYPVVAVLYDQIGAVINHEILINDPDENMTTFYTTPQIVNSGVYLLMISNGRNSETTKIVVP